MSVPDLVARFDALTAFLSRWESVWRPRPFAGEELLWRREHPGLAAWIDRLPADRVNALQEADLSDLPDPLGAWARDARELAALPAAPRAETRLAPPPDRPPRGVRGRKWRQVHAFAEAVLRDPAPPGGWVEWCAGKGHLGRALSRTTGATLTALERDPDLCAQGEAAVAADAPPATFVPVDVLDAPALHVPSDAAVVGLHACGELSHALLRVAVERDAARIAAAPCCPHKGVSDAYRPLSERGRAASLRLGRTSLLLAVSGEVVGGARIRRLRHRSQVWRAAFSHLLGERYHPLPSVPQSQLTGSFRDFAERWAEHEARALPPGWDDADALRAGREHTAWSRRQGLVRAPFRAPLELWTILDRAVWLLEQGRPARVVWFCPREITPRNALILSGFRA